jgi:succinylglutamate desuccinylase
MTPDTTPPRLIGRAGRSPDGAPAPTLLVLAGLHGNEPAGVIAAERVLETIARRGLAPRGTLVALRGNRRALAAGKRFLERDLNRGWSPEAIAAVRAGAEPDGPEGEERRELIVALDQVVAGARGPLFVIDLHTTSATGVAFAMVGADARQRAFAARFPLPVVSGLLGRIRGTLLEYLASAGFLALGMEGGQNDGPDSALNHEALLWLALVELQMLDPLAVPELEQHRARLAGARAALPHLVHVHHRHALWPDDQFRMEPGFANLQRIAEGELLARDRHGEIRAPETGVLLMPLYQTLGDDGFFLGREVG